MSEPDYIIKNWNNRLPIGYVWIEGTNNIKRVAQEPGRMRRTWDRLIYSVSRVLQRPTRSRAKRNTHSA